MQTPSERNSEPFRIPTWLGVCAFLAIAAFFFWEEHRTHILGALPYLLLLACPIIHLFMHRSHGPHGPRHARHERQTLQR